MNREKEIQDELDKYWGQLDRVEKLLKWIAIELIHQRVWSTSAVETPYSHPDISDILEGKE